MKRIKTITFIALLILFFACGKEEVDKPEEKIPLVFTSLTADSYNLEPGDTTTIRAIASGYELSYSWKATLGVILGKGAEITYAVSPCHLGTNKITCTVKDGYLQTETKEIIIDVVE